MGCFEDGVEQVTEEWLRGRNRESEGEEDKEQALVSIVLPNIYIPMGEHARVRHRAECHTYPTR